MAALAPVAGVRIGCAPAGIKQTSRDDLALFELAENSTVAAVFTQNAFCAAPVIVAKKHLAANTPRFLLINSGNANAGVGDAGIQAALACCRCVAQANGCDETAVLPFSTGIIGELLPSEKITAAIPQAMSRLTQAGWAEAAQAIMTTDTMPKGITRQMALGTQTITITGIAKGSGMIHPNMATMLSFIATDAVVASELLQTCLQDAVDTSFNRITVDGDTSTNDACVLVATGQSGVVVDPAMQEAFFAQVHAVCEILAQSIVHDAEGATKFVTIHVEQAVDQAEAKRVAYTVAHSPLVKTALFASDPNWGRILAAVGRADVQNLNVEHVRIYLGDVCIVARGGRAAEYTEARGLRAMANREITIRIILGRGQAKSTIWTSDLSYDYVKINAEYRT